MKVLDDKIEIDHQGPAYVDLLKSLLNVSSYDEIQLLDPSTPDDEKGWDAPVGATLVLDLEGSTLLNIIEEHDQMSYGHVSLQRLVDGTLVVLECNASPYTVYAKKCTDESSHLLL